MSSGPISGDATAVLASTTILPVVTPASPINLNEKTTLAALSDALDYGGAAPISNLFNLGVWTPAVTGVVNVSAVLAAPYTPMHIRFNGPAGTYVLCFLRLTITASGAGATRVDISLPFASTLTGSALYGLGTSSRDGTRNIAGDVSVVSSALASYLYGAVDGVSSVHTILWLYQILP